MSVAAQAFEQLKAEMLLYPQRWIITMPSITRGDLP
jgi:hypothetical protein